jgi:hypothetical protein
MGNECIEIDEVDEVDMFKPINLSKGGFVAVDHMDDPRYLLFTIGLDAKKPTDIAGVTLHLSKEEAQALAKELHRIARHLEA